VYTILDDLLRQAVEEMEENLLEEVGDVDEVTNVC
jgi:hypothetical protein